MNIAKSLGLDKLIARRAEINAAAQRKAETAIVNAVNDAMLAYAETQSADNEKTLESAYDKLCALAFAKAFRSGSSSCAYPLDVALADGRKVREMCADAISPIDRVQELREDVERAKSSIASDTERIEMLKQKYIVEIENSIDKDRAFLADAEAKLSAAEEELSALKVRYNVK